MPRAARRWPEQRAITLIELLMVMVIMTIIISVSVPAFTSLGRGADLRGAVSSVRNAASQARQWAITHREPTILEWVPAATSYYRIRQRVDSAVVLSNTLSGGVHFDTGGQMAFNTDGSLDGAGKAKIKLVKKVGSATKTITVHRLTGAIQVD